MRKVEYQQLKQIPHLIHINRAISFLTDSCTHFIKAHFVEMKHAFDALQLQGVDEASMQQNRQNPAPASTPGFLNSRLAVQLLERRLAGPLDGAEIFIRSADGNGFTPEKPTK